jgi:hypothetical protein
MALTFQDYTANGTAVSFAIPFDRIRDVHVKVFYASTEITTGWSVVGNNVVFVSPPANGTVVRIRRITDFSARLVDYVDGARLNEIDLDTDSKQAFYLIQESRDINDVSMVKNSLGNWEAGFTRIQSVPNPVENNDAANKSYVDQTANNFASYGVAAPTTRWAFTGNGTAVVFAITGATLISSTYYLVTVNGAVRDPATYTVTPNTLTFGTAPANASAIVVVLLGYPRVAEESSIGTLSLEDGAVTAPKLATTLDLSSKTLTLPTGCVDTLQLDTDAVTTLKILNGNVTNDKLGNDISAAKLVTGTLSVDRIGSESILPVKLAQKYTLLAKQTANTLSSVDFLNIPSWATRISVYMNGISSLVASNIVIQLGTSASFDTTGYSSVSGQIIDTATADSESSTVGFLISGVSAVAANAHFGVSVISKLAENTWVHMGNLGTLGSSSNARSYSSSGSKTLANTLTRLRVFPALTSGTTTFDDGEISVAYE